MYRFIHAEKANHSVVLLCRALRVARSSCYAWREGEVARHARQAADDTLAHEITGKLRRQDLWCTGSGPHSNGWAALPWVTSNVTIWPS
ncbi:hypothetical protein OK074_2701 [Actinobacteria bacterium OK074]|nr:hypothetical protein OK074_2701 [Actinobacteria bacterium OK074]